MFAWSVSVCVVSLDRSDRLLWWSHIAQSGHSSVFGVAPGMSTNKILNCLTALYWFSSVQKWGCCSRWEHLHVFLIIGTRAICGLQGKLSLKDLIAILMSWKCYLAPEYQYVSLLLWVFHGTFWWHGNSFCQRKKNCWCRQVFPQRCVKSVCKNSLLLQVFWHYHWFYNPWL